eukprot:scaffold53388_cov30-Tisochrysis_lutea.AAC.1
MTSSTTLGRVRAHRALVFACDAAIAADWLRSDSIRSRRLLISSAAKLALASATSSCSLVASSTSALVCSAISPTRVKRACAERALSAVYTSMGGEDQAIARMKGQGSVHLETQLLDCPLLGVEHLMELGKLLLDGRNQILSRWLVGRRLASQERSDGLVLPAHVRLERRHARRQRLPLRRTPRAERRVGGDR